MSFQSELVRISAGPIRYYTEYQTTTLYVSKAFGGSIHTMTLANDSTTDTVQVSFDGATLEGDIKAGEQMTFHLNGRTAAYIKATTGGGNVRIWGW